MKTVLETKDLTITFGGHVAVDHVNFQACEHQFTSIIGPNGAGKTTFFNLLSGQLNPSKGKILFKNEDITKYSPTIRTRKGIGRSFQITNVFPNLTVLENVRLAVQSRAGVRYQMVKHFKHYHDITEKAMNLLKVVHLENKGSSLTRNLAHGEKRKLEIAMLLALETEVMLLDEPTAGMSVEEVPIILDVIKSIKAQRNRTIILIEHKMDMILDLSDKVVVLFNGKILAEGTPEQIIANDTVQRAYLGGGVHDYATS